MINKRVNSHFLCVRHIRWNITTFYTKKPIRSLLSSFAKTTKHQRSDYTTKWTHGQKLTFKYLQLHIMCGDSCKIITICMLNSSLLRLHWCTICEINIVHAMSFWAVLYLSKTISKHLSTLCHALVIAPFSSVPFRGTDKKWQWQPFSSLESS